MNKGITRTLDKSTGGLLKDIVEPIIEIPIYAVLFMFAAHSFHHSPNWGEAFWFSYFFTAVLPKRK